MSRKLSTFILILSLIFSCCALRINQNLDPESREFLSQVRYIITKSEKNMFLQLDPAMRPQFIEEFKKKRDPDPETEKNEFKETYFKRIEEANLLFRDGNEPGWIQDRGRIYILLGPPTARETYPRGITFYGKPTEIWYYGFFPIWFVDEAWNGTYRIDPYSAQQIAEIMRAQMDMKPKVIVEKPLPDLPAEIIVQEEGKKAVRLSLPYEQIWFEPKAEKLEAGLTVFIEATDEKGAKAWEYKQEYAIVMDKSQLLSYRGQKYVIDIPLLLAPGVYKLLVELRSSTEDRWARKKLSLVIHESPLSLI